MLRAFSVVELWRLRHVCRAFHRWGTAALAALPRVAAPPNIGLSAATAAEKTMTASVGHWLDRA